MATLHVYTYSNTFDVELAFLMASAGYQHLYPMILGPGRNDVGQMVGWGDTNKAAKINAFVDAVQDKSKGLNDVALFTDALDVMILGNATEIVEKFQILEAEEGRSIFFNAEERCFPPTVCNPAEGYPTSPTRSGVFVGRIWALRRMLASHVGKTPHDQEWYQAFYLEHQDLVGLDRECLLLCAIDGTRPRVDGICLARDASRLMNLDTGSSPSVVHFKGIGHWPYMSSWGRTTPTHTAFRHLFPASAAHFFDKPQHMELVLRGASRHKADLSPLLANGIESLMQFFEDLPYQPQVKKVDGNSATRRLMMGWNETRGSSALIDLVRSTARSLTSASSYFWLPSSPQQVPSA
eukprot:CAMPEP_0178375238 /NCGR_PEP_ID=MMETSP0689_2-20121128/2783_1 /TAXON_ID=160604 /ORGANISM="Amphidinium massartii, Strain CS-259" /LENGTH=350 /DNA_ID=CAMNT_0019995221 /DNA_START=332 /DNA_END=1380 /DNA_ORIENTATION=+